MEVIEQYTGILKDRLTDSRFNHSLAVRKEAMRLAKKYGADIKKAELAGLLHDIMKDTPPEEQLNYIKKFGTIMDNVEEVTPKLWHAIAGSLYIKHELGIFDEDILNAVRYHTTARAGMSLLEKTLYLADYTSAERDYEGVDDMRRDVDISMEKAMHTALQFSIIDLAKADRAIHPDTFKAWNELILSNL